MNDIGVVIPTYERVELTLRAVRSALEQTHAPTQVVVVDDGSRRATAQGLAAALDPLGVQFIRGPRTGLPARARNLGVAQLKTSWVAFLDSDDAWLPTKLEVQLRKACTAGGVAICSNAWRVVDGETRGTVLPSLPPRLATANLIRNNVVINSTVLIRSETLRAIGGVAGSHRVQGCEDYATWLRVADVAGWTTVDEPLAWYADAPEISHRGEEEFPYMQLLQQAAWSNYITWRHNNGSPLLMSERLLMAALRRTLLFETSPFVQRVATTLRGPNLRRGALN